MAEAWNNLTFVTKALHFSEARQDRSGDFYKDGLSHAARATSDFAMLEYYLDGFRPHEADESFRKAMAALPPKADEKVTGNGTSDRPANPPQLPDKLVALLHFGRSGTGFLHSLIDGHPEISTLPSIYLRGFFNAGVWKKSPPMAGADCPNDLRTSSRCYSMPRLPNPPPVDRETMFLTWE